MLVCSTRFCGPHREVSSAPLGISCFVIKSTINDDRISLKDVFMGALPFAAVMLVVLMILIEFPILSLALV